MQPTGGGGGGGGGSGGLARFQSAPATWLEQLLESDEDVIIDPPKPPLLPHHHSVANPSSAIDASGFVDPSSGAGGGSGGFLRQNSSPADFLSQIHGSEGYFSSYGIPPVKASYDDYRISSRDVNLEESQVKFTTQMVSNFFGRGIPDHIRPRLILGNFWAEARLLKHAARGRSPRTSRMQMSGDQSALLDVEMDKILADSVPCRVRAKRGFATHPRSIAERVRRTRISDRIRKLQELVPNMDKQTNTADMLEEAVEYVKFLQTQIQDLTDHRNRCTCSVKDQG